jgi:UTP--glucose-1-phosphate uridylyltransferase
MTSSSERNTDAQFAPFAEKMRAAQLQPIAVDTFRHYYGELLRGNTGLISEATLEPIADLPDAEALGEADEAAGRDAIGRAITLKLNGGLGTSMGLEQAKSLLPVKDGLSFLDISARQVLEIRRRYGCAMPLVLMNSFNTREDSLAALARYPELDVGLPLDFMQHQVPKVLQEGFAPAAWPQNPSLEWCPPGHGDIYPALITSGMLDALLGAGYEYAFVSNADNLGAVLDLRILGYVARSGAPFLMEVADRTEADKKGGHLARRADGQLVLRESAQCPKEDEAAFQDTSRHRYFNTNNIWLNLKALKRQLDASGGVIRLPMIRNSKTVDPTDSASPQVYQLETAMGAAIAVFAGAQAIRVPRTRFAPVKLCSDLLALWSDVYTLTEDYHIVVSPARRLGPIAIDLDPRYYKLLREMQARFPDGAPSLIDCARLTVRGDVRFGRGVKVVGDARISHEGPGQLLIEPGSRLEF